MGPHWLSPLFPLALWSPRRPPSRTAANGICLSLIPPSLGNAVIGSGAAGKGIGGVDASVGVCIDTCKSFGCCCCCRRCCCLTAPACVRWVSRNCADGPCEGQLGSRAAIRSPAVPHQPGVCYCFLSCAVGDTLTRPWPLLALRAAASILYVACAPATVSCSCRLWHGSKPGDQHGHATRGAWADHARVWTVGRHRKRGRQDGVVVPSEHRAAVMVRARAHSPNCTGRG